MVFNQIVPNLSGGLGMVREIIESPYLKMWGGIISPKLSQPRPRYWLIFEGSDPKYSISAPRKRQVTLGHSATWLGHCHMQMENWVFLWVDYNLIKEEEPTTHICVHTLQSHVDTRLIIHDHMYSITKCQSWNGLN